MFLFVAAIGATVSAIVELTVGPFLRVGDAQPHFVFIFAIIWAVAAGFESSLAWALAGGLVLDSLAQRPLGSTAFALIICVGLAAITTRIFTRMRPIAVVPAVAILSLVYSMTLFVLQGTLGTPLAATNPVGSLLPGVAYDAVVAVIVGPLAVAVHDRYAEERMDW